MGAPARGGSGARHNRGHYPATARLQSLILLGRPRLFGLLGRDDSLTIPWQEIETIGTDAVLVHTALPEAPPQPEQLKWWQKLRVKLGL